MLGLGNSESLLFVLPEGLLGAFLAVLLLLGAFDRTRRRGVCALVAGTGLVAAAVATIWAGSWAGAQSVFHGMLVGDGMTSVFRLLFFATGLLTVVFAHDSAEIDSRDFADLTVLLLGSVMGMSLMAGASDLLMIYVSMEFVGILSYVLAGLRRENARSSEAALKYAIYGGAASGVMLFGLSLLYGIAGDTSIEIVRGALVRQSALHPLALLALVMVLSGLAFKVAAVPFHQWCPDVYQGAPTPITAFFSVGPKAAGFAVLLRLLYLLLGGLDAPVLADGLMVLVGAVSLASMTYGNLAALNQTSVKRMLAYSSIAHAGYLLMGVATLPAIMAGGNGDLTGFRSVFFYLVMYLLMNLGAFFTASFVVSRLGSDDLSAFRALGKRSPIVAAAMTVFLLALTGIPPTAGFAGKFYLVYGVLAQGHGFLVVLAIAAMLNSFLSLFYYARILKTMYLDRSEDSRPVPVGAYATAVLAILGVPTILFGLWFSPVLDAAEFIFR